MVERSIHLRYALRAATAAALDHPNGFAVRLHNLGDFYSTTYVELWRTLLERHSALHPAKVDFKQGAGIWVPYGTAYHALFHQAKAHASETVLVHGASGGVGIAAVGKIGAP